MLTEKIKSIESKGTTRSIISGLKRNLIYFLQNTTLHGLKYVAEDLITIPERVFFGLAFLIVFIGSSFFISQIYDKWTASPIIIVSNPKPISLTEIPFPAITICNMNQARKSRVSKMDKRSSNYSLLLGLCNQDSGEVNMTYAGTWKFFKAILLDVAQPCQDLLLYCSFGSHIENCNSIFNTMLTDDGLCCTFNALDLKYVLRNYSEENLLLPPEVSDTIPIDWTPEKGYDKHIAKSSPRVSGGVGRRMGLTVVLNASSAEYYCTKTNSIGFKILVHNPADLPKISNYGFLIPAGWVARIPIEPMYQDAHTSIRSISKSIRHCLYSDEGDLQYYRTYSRKNCELECEALLLLERCSCSLYYLPRNDPSVRICGPKDNQCTHSVLSEIESSNKTTCSTCLAGCFEINYRTSVSTSPIIVGKFLGATEYPPYIFNEPKSLKDITIMHFYYTYGQLRGTTKTQIYGFSEFVSNIGGLLSLLMGFSIFSLIEIIYYITIRPYCFARTIEKMQLEPQNIEQIQDQWATKRKLSHQVYSANKKFYNKNLKNVLQNQNHIYNQSKTYSGPIYPYLE